MKINELLNETRTYYAVVDKDGKPATAAQKKKLGTRNYGYPSIKKALAAAPNGSSVEERHESGSDDWGGRIAAHKDEDGNVEIFIKEATKMNESKTGNEGSGYHGRYDSAEADKKFEAMFKRLKKLSGNSGDLPITSYLDSAHGRHLADLEKDGQADDDYIKKDFNKFMKTFKWPDQPEGKTTKADVISLLKKKGWEDWKGGTNWGDNDLMLKSGERKFELAITERGNYLNTSIGIGTSYVMPMFKKTESPEEIVDYIEKLMQSRKGWSRA